MLKQGYKKILFAIFSCFISIIIPIKAQSSTDTLGKSTAFFVEIKKSSCNEIGTCSNASNPYLKCYTDNLLIHAANAKRQVTLLRVLTNDSIKAGQCASIRYSNELFPYFWESGGVKILEYTFNCKIIDTIINVDTWVVKVGNKTKQDTPLIHDKEIPFIEYNGGVFLPKEDIDYTDYLVVKNGKLIQLLYYIEDMTNQIVIPEDTKTLLNRYTFEMSVFPFWEKDFYKIREGLKKAIGFEMYKAKMPVKMTYLKFLE